MTGSVLPGSDLVTKGLTDLRLGEESVEALLVSIGAPRLRRLGLVIVRPFPDPEARLYAWLARVDSDCAHGRYNALVRGLVRFERAAECSRSLVGDLVHEGRLTRFLHELAVLATEETRIYLTGGATALLYGWRASTKDVDLKLVPDRDELFRELPRLKDSLQINVELAAPEDFIPRLPGWEGRSPFVLRVGRTSVHHYDLYSQALAKLERGHERDLQDVRAMLDRRLVEPSKLRQLFEAVVPQLYRYPAIDPPSFRRAVEIALEEYEGRPALE